MKIAVITIAKNEQEFVKRWADSAKDADFLLIADTGSSDKTVEIARSLGVNVLTINISPWRFDDARNAALAAVPLDIDFVINMDMDEVLVAGWRQHLEKVKPDTTRPRYQYTWSWADKEETKPGLQYGGDKIAKRSGYRWKHPVHEVMVTDRLTEVQEWIGLEIHHHPDHSKSRGQYFPLLEQAVAEDPHDDRNSFYLAREYFFNAMFDKASKEFRRHLALPSSVWGPERAASMRYLAKIEPENRFDWLQKAIAEAPGRREALVEYAQYLYEKQDWADCYEVSLNALAIASKPLDYLCEDFAWGALPYDLAAISAYNMQMYREAVEFGAEAERLSPEDERLRTNSYHYRQALQ